MSMDYWVALSDSEREHWGFVPGEIVGPLNFGMTERAVFDTMAGRGFTGSQDEVERWNTARMQWRITFHKAEADRWNRPAVKCYFVEGVGLTCVLLDGLRGPQVTHEGIPLIGRVPSELSQDIEAYATRKNIGIRFNHASDILYDGMDTMINRGAQRAGDTVVTWAVFFNLGEIAGTSWDILPADVWHHG
ncbi:hypothetical protein ACQEVM_37630 [Streptomyces sp. CA-243310]|uniref:hypothetical protein n=1 Tax=Streptomyces sp. CA-243310 TaxID=3240056 RepID=UPI003D90AA62